MAKSFSVDLNRYTIYKAIGLSERRVERKADTLDLISILMDEGYSVFETPSSYIPVCGVDQDGLRNQVRGKTMGVPADSVVCIRRLGSSKIMLVTFKDHGGEG